MIPQARIRCTAAGFAQAAELMADLIADRGRLLALAPGSEYRERTNGHTFMAYRMACGGIDIRESMPVTREGWAELESTQPTLDATP